MNTTKPINPMNVQKPGNAATALVMLAYAIRKLTIFANEKLENQKIEKAHDANAIKKLEEQIKTANNLFDQGDNLYKQWVGLLKTNGVIKQDDNGVYVQATKVPQGGRRSKPSVPRAEKKKKKPVKKH